MLVKQRIDFLQRYTLTDLFDRTFRMIGTSWKVSLLGGLVIMGPAAILLAIGGPLQIKNAISISIEASEGATGGVDALLRLLLWTAASIVAGLLYAAAALWARLAVIHTVRDSVMTTAPRWSDSVRQALHVSLLRVIGQAALKALIGAAIFLAPTGLLLLVAFGGGWTPPLLIAFIYVAATVILIWIFVSLVFSAEAVVFDGERGVRGLRKSWSLVRGNWWRLFGISLLVTIMISFVSGLISTPIVGASFIPMSSQLVDVIMGGNASDEAILRAFANTGAFAVAIGLATILQQLVSLLFVPVFYSLFYVDLKVRHGELEPRTPDAYAPADPGTPPTEPPRDE